MATGARRWRSRSRRTATATDFAATSFHQKSDLSEAFFDTHLTHRFGARLVTTAGLNELFGLAHQCSAVFIYALPADGSPPQSSSQGTPTDAATLSDTRNFADVYAQTRWTPLRSVAVLGGLCFNRTHERRRGDDTDDALSHRAGTSRLSGSLGLNWRVWQDAEADLDDVTTYLELRQQLPAAADRLRSRGNRQPAAEAGECAQLPVRH